MKILIVWKNAKQQNVMNRIKVILTIKKNTDSFTKDELESYSNKRLYFILKVTLLNIRIKQLKNIFKKGNV